MRTLDRVQYKKGTKIYNGVVSEQDVELKVENNSISYSNDGVNYNKSLPILQGDTSPTTSTVGEIGQFYLDKTNVNVYQCFGAVQTPPLPPEYQWELMGGRAKQNILSSAIVMDGTIDKSLGFNSLGVLVKGSAGGETSTSYSQVTLGDMRSDIYTNKYKEIVITIGNNHYNFTRPQVSINISDGTMTYTNLSGAFMVGPAKYYFKKQVQDDGYGVTYVCEHGYDSKSKIFLYFTSSQVYINNERTPNIDGTSTIYIYGPKQQNITNSTEKVDITLIN